MLELIDRDIYFIIISLCKLSALMELGMTLMIDHQETYSLQQTSRNLSMNHCSVICLSCITSDLCTDKCAQPQPDEELWWVGNFFAQNHIILFALSDLISSQINTSIFVLLIAALSWSCYVQNSESHFVICQFIVIIFSVSKLSYQWAWTWDTLIFLLSQDTWWAAVVLNFNLWQCHLMNQLSMIKLMKSNNWICTSLMTIILWWSTTYFMITIK